MGNGTSVLAGKAFTLSLPHAAGLRITIGASSETNLDQPQTVPFDAASFRYLGGRYAPLGTTYPGNYFGGVQNLTLSDGTRQGIGGIVTFRTDAQTFDVLTLGQGTQSNFDLLVDGVLVKGDSTSLPPDGGLRFMTVDFSRSGFAAGPHDVELIYNGGGSFGGLRLPANASLYAPPAPGPRIVFLGDSITEGAGAISEGQDYASLTGHYLGLTDVWQSAFGGTGYERTLGNRPNLDGRIVADGVAAHGAIYVVAMGINDDENSPTLFATVTDTLGKLVHGAPNAQIFVVADWNPLGPSTRIWPTGVATIKAAAAQFPSIHFLDPGGVAYTKVDPTHPDQAGHETLAKWLSVQIENTIGDKVHHSADIVFQDEATGAISAWQVAGDGVVGGGGFGSPGGTWTALSHGDFAADGGTDVLFRDAAGTLATWTTNGVTLTGGGTIGNPGADWSWLATADFNGDGKSDLLFHNTVTGAYATWDIDRTRIVGGGTIGVAAGYTFVATGDLNGDGKADVLFKDASGAYAAWLIDDIGIVGGGAIANPGPGWTFKGLGDFNGDGRADLLFENAGGTYATWDMNGTAIVGGGTIGDPGGTFKLAAIADLNQDGKADMLFVDGGGHYASWLMNDIAIAGGAPLGSVPAGLHPIA